MDLAYVDKLAKNNEGIKFLLNRQYWLDRTIDAKGMETKLSGEKARGLSTIITKRIDPGKFRSTREQKSPKSF